MKNQQRPEPRQVSDGHSLDLVDVFMTIQGEGPFAGTPALFVRLAGCNLQCPLCDTEYTEGRYTTGIGELLAKVAKEREQHKFYLVVITGGEPFRQNILPFILGLRSMRLKVQIETNGKVPMQERLLPGIATIVVSPKTHRIDPTIAAMADAFKYVVQWGDVAIDGLPTRALGHPVPVGTTIARPPETFAGPIYIQPADEHDEHNNSLNMDAAVKAVLINPAQRKLCLQMHKYADLP